MFGNGGKAIGPAQLKSYFTPGRVPKRFPVLATAPGNRIELGSHKHSRGCFRRSFDPCGLKNGRHAFP
jgi:hypothetical protein